MSKRFRDDYGDNSQINIFNSNNQNVKKSIKDMTRDELETYEKDLLQKLNLESNNEL